MQWADDACDAGGGGGRAAGRALSKRVALGECGGVGRAGRRAGAISEGPHCGGAAGRLAAGGLCDRRRGAAVCGAAGRGDRGSGAGWILSGPRCGTAQRRWRGGPYGALHGHERGGACGSDPVGRAGGFGRGDGGWGGGIGGLFHLSRRAGRVEPPGTGRRCVGLGGDRRGGCLSSACARRGSGGLLARGHGHKGPVGDGIGFRAGGAGLARGQGARAGRGGGGGSAAGQSRGGGLRAPWGGICRF